MGRLTTRLLAAGERLNVWAEHPESLQQAGAWPESQPVRSLAPADEPLVQLSPESIDRQIVVWSPRSGEHLDIRRLIDCDEVLWLTEPSEGQAVFGYLRRAASELGELSEKVRVVWLLDANTRVAPWLAGWDLKKPELKAPVESTGKRLTRLESQGLDRLVRALRGFSVGIALAGGGAKGMAHFGVLRALEEAGISFDAMTGTSAGAMVGIFYAAGMSPESADRPASGRARRGARALRAPPGSLPRCARSPNPPRRGRRRRAPESPQPARAASGSGWTPWSEFLDVKRLAGGRNAFRNS